MASTDNLFDLPSGPSLLDPSVAVGVTPAIGRGEGASSACIRIPEMGRLESDNLPSVAYGMALYVT